MAETSLKVCEIYKTIQGESTYAGRPCVMIRLSGCNLDCTYCDTAYAKSGGEDMTVSAVVERVLELNESLVEVTGGEPLLQTGTSDLLRALLSAGKTVLLETNGSVPIDAVPGDVIRIYDIKCPGSGEEKKNRWENMALLADHDEIKFVLCGREDYDWAKNIIKEYGLNGPAILFSPVPGRLEAGDLASWILKDGLRARLNLQLHKIIWPDGGENPPLPPSSKGEQSPAEGNEAAPRKAVVLLSGGLDSATVLACAGKEGFETYALTFDYGQRHTVELTCAGKTARALGAAEHRILRIDLAPLAASALTGSGEIPKDRKEVGNDIPPTYVPARNLIFLSFAAAWAESLGCRDIFIGVSHIDYSGYPDCRPEFIDSFETTVNLATKLGVGGSKTNIRAPFLFKSKAEIIKMGMDLGVDYSLTHSCYDPGPAGEACGRCDSCNLRRRAFEDVGKPDPALP